MEREAIRVQQPDGSFKVIFREKSKMPGNHEAKPEVKQESREKPRKERKEKPQDPRYFNPLNPEHIDIFGKDLLNKDLIFSLNSGESLKGKMTGYAQYEILIEFAGKKVILMKQAIAKVEVL
jgi:hypothetical protein